MEGDAIRFFLMLNFVSLLVFLQEPETASEEDWVTDLFVMTNIMTGISHRGEDAHSSLRLTCESSDILLMMNSSSFLFDSKHNVHTLSLRSE